MSSSDETMDVGALADFYGRPADAVLADDSWSRAHEQLLLALESGRVRAAAREASGSWRAVPWVKQAILIGFRGGAMVEIAGPWGAFFDKTTYPVREFAQADGVRTVPGGSSIRRGSHVARGVVTMPPCFVNVGAFVDAGTMVDSHVLVGSCAQIGKGVHLSAAVQVGGVLEPAGATPVVVEDGAFVGAGALLLEGVCVRERAVIAAGVALTGSSTIYDLVHDCTWQREVPTGAVVVPGSRPARGAYAEQHGLQLQAPIIVKYRDDKTDAATALEQGLR